MSDLGSFSFMYLGIKWTKNIFAKIIRPLQHIYSNFYTLYASVHTCTFTLEFEMKS